MLPYAFVNSGFASVSSLTQAPFRGDGLSGHSRVETDETRDMFEKPTNPYGNAAINASMPQEGNPRATEAWALTESGRRMALATRGGRTAMRDALRLNWRLWTIFQADLTVAIEAQDQPSEVMLNMLTLCQFVDKHTVASLSEPSPERLQVLIDINRNIAAGLRDSLARENQGRPSPEGGDDSVVDKAAVG